MIAGEWAGKGVQAPPIAVASLDPFYVIFGIRVRKVWLDRHEWQQLRFTAHSRIFNIHQFKTYSLIVDFTEDRREGGGKRVIELAEEVQKECPVALKIGGIKNGIGEGIVWIEVRDSNLPPGAS